ncbi:MAG: hypothetical protein RIB43_09730 [Rhodospirillaceae bacterium]
MEIAKADLELANNRVLAGAQATANFATNSLKFCQILNGGAVVALLAYMGSNKVSTIGDWLLYGFTCYATALGITGVASILFYVGQHKIESFEEQGRKTGIFFHSVGGSFLLLANVSFISGSICVLKHFS